MTKGTLGEPLLCQKRFPQTPSENHLENRDEWKLIVCKRERGLEYRVQSSDDMVCFHWMLKYSAIECALNTVH